MNLVRFFSTHKYQILGRKDGGEISGSRVHFPLCMGETPS